MKNCKIKDMTLDEFQKWLDGFLNFEKTQEKNIFWLDTMKVLCEKLSHPEQNFPCIHIAGSKGKGSVSSMIANILCASGKKCGIYTSPHISDFRERISTPEGFFSDEIYEKSADELYDCVSNIKESELPGNRKITWFELVTAYAFLCFKNAKVDFAVFETGLGGRLDSTNVVKPLLSVLMQIEKEHTEFLGDTIEKIASEKAGIIKQNTPCIVSFQNYKEAEEVFKTKAQKENSDITFLKDVLKSFSYNYTNQNKVHVISELKIEGELSHFTFDLHLLGKVQVYNAFTALCAVKKVFPDFEKKYIEKGLENAFLPGRFEIVNKNAATVILDGAHTPFSIKNTILTLKEVFPNKKYSLLFAVAKDKDVEDIVLNFKNVFSNIILTKPGTVRKSDIKSAEKAFLKNGIKFLTEEDCKKACEKALENARKSGSVLLVTGSFYLLSEVKKFFKEN